MKNLIYDYIKTSISPIKLLEISKELEIDFKSVKECVTQLESESLVFKHSNRGYLSTPERVKASEQAKVSTSKENAPKKPRKPKQPSKVQQVKELKEKIKVERKNKPKEPKVRKQRQKMDAETWRKHKSAYDASRRVKRKLLHGECEANRLAKRPTRPIGFMGDVMASDDMVYFRLDKRLSGEQGSCTCMKIADLERLLTIVKELQSEN